MLLEKICCERMVASCYRTHHDATLRRETPAIYHVLKEIFFPKAMPQYSDAQPGKLQKVRCRLILRLPCFMRTIAVRLVMTRMRELRADELDEKPDRLEPGEDNSGDSGLSQTFRLRATSDG